MPSSVAEGAQDGPASIGTDGGESTGTPRTAETTVQAHPPHGSEGGRLVAAAQLPAVVQQPAQAHHPHAMLPGPAPPPHGPAGTWDRPLAQGEPKEYRRFTSQRERWPPMTPQSIREEQAGLGYENPAADYATQFEFACPEKVTEDALYLRYRPQARADIFVDVLYWGTPWERLVNSCGRQGSKSVPAVSTHLGPSINWSITFDGMIRVDGKQAQVDIINRMLRKALPQYHQGRTAHGAITGRQPSRTVHLCRDKTSCARNASPRGRARYLRSRRASSSTEWGRTASGMS